MEKLQHILNSFGVKADVVSLTEGITFDIARVILALGVKAKTLTNTLPDISRAMGVYGIKVSSEVDEDGAILLEIPRKSRQILNFVDIINDVEFSSQTQFIVGVASDKSVVLANLTDLPHAIIAGTSGSGKSVFIHTVITSLLWHNSPKQLQIALIDPKLLEFQLYKGCPHLYRDVATDVEAAHNILDELIEEMRIRYELMANIGARTLVEYNKKAAVVDEKYVKPHIVLVVDELADLIFSDKTVTDKLVVLTQKARACGITCILATQRPDRSVLSGLLLSNTPTKISLKVGSAVDSRVILGSSGAETLQGRGDLLYCGPDGLTQRLQGANINTDEILSIVEVLKEQYK